jgi:biopolymer transport protein ExbB/TolQ
MMHDLVSQLARYGGEGALGVLFVLSIVNLGIIGQRVWFFVSRRVSTNQFVQELVPLLRIGDVRRAQSLSQQSPASVCCVATAGLFQAERGLPAVERALATTISRERIVLENNVVVMSELGRIALLVGVVGSLCDLVALGGSTTQALPPEAVLKPIGYSTIVAAMAPTIGAFLVAIPAWLARSIFNVYVQRVMRECEFVARLVLSELVVGDPAPAGSFHQVPKTRRVAA